MGAGMGEGVAERDSFSSKGAGNTARQGRTGAGQKSDLCRPLVGRCIVRHLTAGF